MTKKSRTKARLPAGWSEDRVRRVAEYYDRQSEDDAEAEIVEGFDKERDTVVIVPKRLLPAIRDLMHRHRARAG